MANLALREAYNYDVVKGEWTALAVRTTTAPRTDARCIAFDNSGTFLAVAATVGVAGGSQARVQVWDITTIPVIARVLAVPSGAGNAPAQAPGSAVGSSSSGSADGASVPSDTNGGAVPGTPAADAGAGSGAAAVTQRRASNIVGVAWSSSGCRLAVLDRSGCATVFDVASGVVCLSQRFDALRKAKSHDSRIQFDPSCDDRLLLCQASSWPFVVNVSTGAVVRSVTDDTVTQRKGDEGRRMFCDAVYVGTGSRILVASGKGSLSLLDASTLGLVKERHVKSGNLLVPRLFLCSDPTWVFLGTRAGIHVFHADTLECVDKGYREGVDNTPLSLCSLSHDRATVVAAPGAEVGGAAHNNCLFVFRTGIAGDIRIVPLPEPLERVRSLAWHPWRPLLVACMTTGHVYMLHRPYRNNWPGVMYPNGYTILLENRQYAEREDEFDDFDEDGEPLPKRPRCTGEGQDVDIVGAGDADTKTACHAGAGVGGDDGAGAGVGAGAGGAQSPGGGAQHDTAGSTADASDSDDHADTLAEAKRAWEAFVRSGDNGMSAPLSDRVHDAHLSAWQLKRHGPGGDGPLKWLPPSVEPRTDETVRKRARPLVWPLRNKAGPPVGNLSAQR